MDIITSANDITMLLSGVSLNDAIFNADTALAFISLWADYNKIIIT